MRRTRVDAVGEGTSLHDRKRRAGERVVLGFEGTGLSEDFRKVIHEVQPSGYIIFQRNIESPAQLLELTRELRSLSDEHRPCILTIDQEGGRVQRVRAPATIWPSARAVAAADLVEQVSFALAQELRAMGIDLNFAPVADVDSNPGNPVIGDRSFSATPDEVSRAVQAWIQGHHRAGMGTCAKHFPGHGDTHLDSHLDLPTVEVDLETLQHREFPPFAAAVRSGVHAIMSAHVVFPAIDPTVPCTLSPRVMPNLLRRDLTFDGVVFSDDMDMKAIADRWPNAEAVRLANLATVDTFLCCRKPARQLDMYEALIHTQEQALEAEIHASDSERRMATLREHLLLHTTRPPLSVLACDDHRELAARVLSRTQ